MVSFAWVRRSRAGITVGAITLVLSIWLQHSFAELNSPNPLVRIYLTRALVDDGSVSIDGPIQRYGGISDKSRREGRYYCDKAPGVSLLAVPIYGTMRLFAEAQEISNKQLLLISRFFLCALPTFLCLFLVDLWLLALAVAERRRSATLALLGGGSLMLPYGLELFGHVPAAFFVLLCAFLAVGRATARAGEGRATYPAWRVVAAGFAGGMAVLCEYPTLLLVGVFLLAGMVSSRRRLRFALLVAVGGLLPALAFCIYNNAAFGGPFTTGYAFIDNAFFRNIHAQGFMGLSTPRADAFFASFFSPARGIFFAAPWCCAAPLGVWVLWKKDRPAAIALIAAAVIYALFISSFRYWLGGWALGQRHLTPMFPLAAVATGLAFEALFKGHGRWFVRGRVLLAALGAVAIVQIGAACLTMPTFAEEFVNPFFELSQRLWRLGLFPHSIGTALGMSSRVGILVPAVLALWLVLLCLRAAAPSWLPWMVDGTQRALAGLVLGCWFVIAPMLGQGDGKSQHRFEWIVDTVWEPRDALPAKLPDPVKVLPNIPRRPPQSALMLRHLARHLAASGQSAQALELVGRAILLERGEADEQR